MSKFIMLFSMLMLTAVFAFAQQRTVSGSIKDNQGNPVPFATVAEQGTKNATTADGSGNFTLQMKGNNALLVTATGYEPVTVTPTGNSVQVVMTINPQELATVTVTTALGIQRSKNTLPCAAQQVT